MSKTKGLLSGKLRAVLLLIVFAAAVCLIVRNIGAFGNILLVVLGFGAVVLVHEFGHFIVAKAVGIKVEAFSIGFPPVLAGIKRTETGLRIRILPGLLPKENGGDGDGLLTFTVGKKSKQGETEYRIGLIPFGGFVKMLGQDDVGTDKAIDDPRSFANKSIVSRMAVISAGVVFNAVSAIAVFMVVFLIGIKLPPAVVGAVVPDSPAARAGLKPGDEIIQINGKKGNLDFSNIAMAAALSGKEEKVKMKVRRQDGTVKDFEIAAEQLPGQAMKMLGVEKPTSLTIAKVSDANALFERTGLVAGDRIKSVNGIDVQNYWELAEIVKNALVPEVKVLTERVEENKEKAKLIESQIQLKLSPASKEVKSESDLAHIGSMVPRLQITAVLSDKPSSFKDKLLSTGIKKRVVDTEPELQSGDIILAAGDVENPTYKELREVTEEYENKGLTINVLRIDADGLEKTIAVTVVPKRQSASERVMIGIGVALDAEHPVVAKTIDVENGPAKLEIPRGASITAVGGVEVLNFYDIIREIRRNAGQRITIDYRLNKKTAGNVAVDVDGGGNFITVKSAFADFVPFEDLKVLYKADSPLDAIIMGYKKTVMFIVQTYVTLKRLVSGLVSTKNLTGPIGIIMISYSIVAQQPLVYYVYFLGLISACIAVFNFLPLPPLDGGLVVLLLVEKVKGSALSERTQGFIAYAGWVMIGTLFLYVTFNDIVRSFFGG